MKLLLAILLIFPVCIILFPSKIIKIPKTMINNSKVLPTKHVHAKGVVEYKYVPKMIKKNNNISYLIRITRGPQKNNYISIMRCNPGKKNIAYRNYVDKKEFNKKEHVIFINFTSGYHSNNKNINTWLAAYGYKFNKHSNKMVIKE